MSGHPSDYETYVGTKALFDALKPDEDLANQDERLFQVTHQTAELWMKVIAHEIPFAVKALQEQELRTASSTFRRCAMIERLISRELGILETMAPKNYQQIRMGLGRGSGSESPGFRYMLTEIADPVWKAFSAVMEAEKVTLFDVWMDPEGRADLHELVTSIIDFDQSFQEFRYHHLNLARREIGLEVKSLKGVPAEVLTKGATEPLFPELWTSINEVTRAFRPEY
ncbi:MAG TPA: tryptophan 2,3-dioxygenase family protein [Actinomycetota bacterium]|nr:tryptophan 2,3-dioxygenase family protein [Actinomycetota bacterium]